MSKIIGLEKFSLVDYEGKMACTIFFSKCNFRCPFCHNSHLIDECGDEYTLDEIYDFLNSRKNKLEAVVISGGEPTLYEGLEEFIDNIKNMGYLIKLDTNGSKPDALNTIIKKIDYIAMDIKNDDANYFKTIGISNEKYLDNVHKSIELIMNSGIKYEFRTTLVNEFHTEESIKNLGAMIKGADKLYLQKFFDRETCIMRDLHEVSKEDALKYKDFLKDYVKSVELRSY